MFPIIQTTELICFLLAFFCLRNTGNIVWTVIKWFLLFTLLTEVSARLIVLLFHQHNLWLYNIYTAINFFTICWTLYKLLPAHLYNYGIYIGSLGVFSVFFVAETLMKGIFISNVISDAVSCILLLIMCNWYFYLLLQKDEWIEIQNHAEFWFITGLMLFCFCTIATDMFDEPLTNLFITRNLPLQYILYIVFNLILYGCWSYAFVCKYRETI